MARQKERCGISERETNMFITTAHHDLRHDRESFSDELYGHSSSNRAMPSMHEYLPGLTLRNCALNCAFMYGYIGASMDPCPLADPRDTG